MIRRDSGAAAKVAGAATRQAVGRAQVLGYNDLDRGNAFITNNVPYIVRLNDGSSKQQPRGFVQRAIRKAVTIDIRTGL